MKKQHVLIFAVCFLVAVCIVLAALATVIHVTSTPPMTGTIVNKCNYPAYYPTTYYTPWKYELVIASDDGKRYCTWQVSDTIYNIYEIGDQVQRWRAKEVGE